MEKSDDDACSIVRERSSALTPVVIQLPYDCHTGPCSIKSNSELFSKKPDVEQQAAWWKYALLNRGRWSGTKYLKEAQQSRAMKLWSEYFETSNAFTLNRPLPIAIEVDLHSTSEHDNTHLRVMPWEFVVDSVIQAYRPAESEREHRVPVLRHWSKPGAQRRTSLPENPRDWKILVVLSAPGFISSEYHLKSERDFLYEIFCSETSSETKSDTSSPDTDCFKTLWTPTFDEIVEELVAFEPDIVHFAGCDIRQAIELTATPYTREHEMRINQMRFADNPDVLRPRAVVELDGYALLHKDSPVLQGGQAQIDLVSQDRLWKLFDQHKPFLVCWNLYHSGQIAASAVGLGKVCTSVGFQDSIDDGLAEEYFDEFYRGLVATKGAVALAHVRGWQAVLRMKFSLNGSGIVFWTSQSNVEDLERANARALAEPTKTTEIECLPASPNKPDGFSIDVKVPEGGLNYAQLHQKQYPFSRFRIYLGKGQKLSDVDLEVKLNGEDRELCYRTTLSITAPFEDLREKIEFPLTAPLSRSCRESVATTLSVTVAKGDRVLHSDTYPTRLLPADQWRFAEGSAYTLASFVFPRDAETERLILNAQKYVRVLRDDPMAGFDGYQASDVAGVDLQVRAIWSALLHEYRLGYINPPPAYSQQSDSQRLRTPTMVLTGGWGTCVDLALLFAAALELVDIYPVIFVFEAHALVGYWRSPEAHDSFIRMDRRGDTDPTDWEVNSHADTSGMFLSSSSEEILSYLESGELIALETTLLTASEGFERAMLTGARNVTDAVDFDYMIDLLSARAAQITPLPLHAV
ncbi:MULTISPECIES: hypothetical protein [unclassified Caballeronia]|uniref:hypothetical protein n=1 Tax=unclassified Caballeronia TaxID=2646786 RepID=UPI0002EF5EBE|nr:MULTISPECIES: hypothetical protein [unclassified Caballeronia]MCE4546447.1 hypothetical protein [Caballeronia sp. PC1]MCE4573080.1 hypothetical protein [Caballeronia sp. CLC5]